MSARTLLLLGCLWLACTAAVHAAEGEWALTTADFETRTVRLRGVYADGVAVTALPPSSQQQAIPLDQFLELSRPGAPAVAATPDPFVLQLAGGDRLTGRPASGQDETLTWSSRALGQLAFPLSQVRAVVREGRPSLPCLDEQLKEDVVLLSNGDTVRGVISHIAADKVTVQSGSGDLTPVSFDGIDAVLLATTAAPTAVAAHAFRIRFDDGSSVTTAMLGLAADRLSFTLPDRSTRELPVEHVVGIEQLNGPVSWLSSRAAAESVQTPYDGDLLWPARMDQNVLGKPIRFSDRSYPHGIGVHAYSRLVYPLNGQYKTFRTQYAIDTSAGDGRLADVTVRVKLDDRTVHEQKGFKAGVLSRVITVPLENAARLTLEVDYGANGDRQARLNWIEPALLRTAPAATNP